VAAALHGPQRTTHGRIELTGTFDGKNFESPSGSHFPIPDARDQLIPCLRYGENASAKGNTVAGKSQGKSGSVEFLLHGGSDRCRGSEKRHLSTDRVHVEPCNVPQNCCVLDIGRRRLVRVHGACNRRGVL
jgi:hypothetical protein